MAIKDNYHLLLINVKDHIINLMGHHLVIIIMRNLFFIGSYGVNMDVIHLLVLFEY
jgi:hypothetical protein